MIINVDAIESARLDRLGADGARLKIEYRSEGSIPFEDRINEEMEGRTALDFAAHLIHLGVDIGGAWEAIKNSRPGMYEGFIGLETPRRHRDETQHAHDHFDETGGQAACLTPPPPPMHVADCPNCIQYSALGNCDAKEDGARIIAGACAFFSDRNEASEHARKVLDEIRDERAAETADAVAALSSSVVRASACDVCPIPELNGDRCEVPCTAAKPPTSSADRARCRWGKKIADDCRSFPRCDECPQEQTGRAAENALRVRQQREIEAAQLEARQRERRKAEDAAGLVICAECNRDVNEHPERRTCAENRAACAVFEGLTKRLAEKDRPVARCHIAEEMDVPMCSRCPFAEWNFTP